MDAEKFRFKSALVRVHPRAFFLLHGAVEEEAELGSGFAERLPVFQPHGGGEFAQAFVDVGAGFGIGAQGFQNACFAHAQDNGRFQPSFHPALLPPFDASLGGDG